MLTMFTESIEREREKEMAGMPGSPTRRCTSRSPFLAAYASDLGQLAQISRHTLGFRGGRSPRGARAVDKEDPI